MLTRCKNINLLPVLSTRGSADYSLTFYLQFSKIIGAMKNRFDPGFVERVTITVLVDNKADMIVDSSDTVQYFTEKPLLAEHGFSALIQPGDSEETILWDAGGSDVALIENMRRMKLDFNTITKIALSHGHWDHYGGLPALADVGVKAPLYAPMSLPISVRMSIWPGERLLLCNTSQEVCEGACTTGQLLDPLAEHGLILHTADGLVLITGHEAVLFQTIKAARANPIEALRYE